MKRHRKLTLLNYMEHIFLDSLIWKKQSFKIINHSWRIPSESLYFTMYLKNVIIYERKNNKYSQILEKYKIENFNVSNYAHVNNKNKKNQPHWYYCLHLVICAFEYSCKSYCLRGREFTGSKSTLLKGRRFCWLVMED